jgi:hypothetical protein
MQSKNVFLLVLSFGVAFSMLAGAGIGPAVFGESPADAESSRTLDEVANQSNVDDESGGGLGADVEGDAEPTLVGVAISGGKFVVNLVASVTLLPLMLMRLGFPAYFAVPLGGVAQIIAFIGLVEFIRTGELT